MSLKAPGSKRASSSFDALKIRNGAGGLADFIEELEAVLAQILFIRSLRDIDGNLVEESIDAWPKLRHCAHGRFEILARTRRRCVLLRGFDRTRKRSLLILAVEQRVRRPGIFAIVLLLFDSDDVCGALVAGEKISAILGFEQFAQRLDPADNENKIILATEREHRVHEIVPRALFAQLHLQPVDEEGEKISDKALPIRASWHCPIGILVPAVANKLCQRQR